MKDKKVEDLKIIICDDSKLARKSTEKLLKTRGVKDIRLAETGDIAISKYKEEKADIVLLDLLMPNKTGIETLKELIEFDKDVTVIIVSSAGTSVNLKEALKIGAKDFVQKPIIEENINSIIIKLLNDGGNKNV